MAINRARRWRRLASLTAGSAVLSAALLAGGAAAANAATPSAVDDESCSYDLGTATMVCVAPGQNLDKAVLQQTGLVVEVAPAPGTKTRNAATVTPNATYIQSILYEDQGHSSGNYLRITNSSACNGSTVYHVGDLGAPGFSFNNRVSSFQSYSGCTTKLWENTNYTGASVGYYTSTSYVGDAMNDRASSVQIR